jgi:hypothetical protein
MKLSGQNHTQGVSPMRKEFLVTHCIEGLGQRIPYNSLLRAGRSGDRMAVGKSDRTWSPPSLLCSGCWVFFSGLKKPRRGFENATPSNSQVKERVEF